MITNIKQNSKNIKEMSYRSLEDGDTPTYDEALENLTQFAKKFKNNTVYNEIQKKNLQMDHYPSVKEAGKRLEQLSAKIQRHIEKLK